MSELFEKLSKQRSKADEGLNFESGPTPVHSATAKSGSSSVHSGSSGAITKRKSTGGEDLKSILSRRRAEVDDEGEHFESKAAVSTADAATKIAGTVPAVASMEAPVADAPVSEEQPPAAIEEVPLVEEIEHVPLQEKLEPDVEELAAPTTQTLEIQEVNANESAEPPRQDLSNDSDEETDTKDDGVVQTAFAKVPTPCRSPFPLALRPGVVNGGEISITERRINWSVPLDKTPLPESFESPEFAIGATERCYLQLRLLGDGGCSLALHSNADRSAKMRIMLFAGKGWAKQKYKPWPAGADLEEMFNINLIGRSSILCGVVYED